MDMDKPHTFDIRREGKTLRTGLKDINAVFIAVLKCQSQSYSWALKFGGYKIIQVFEDGTEEDVTNEVKY